MFSAVTSVLFSVLKKKKNVVAETFKKELSSFFSNLTETQGLCFCEQHGENHDSHLWHMMVSGVTVIYFRSRREPQGAAFVAGSRRRTASTNIYPTFIINILYAEEYKTKRCSTFMINILYTKQQIPKNIMQSLTIFSIFKTKILLQEQHT